MHSMRIKNTKSRIPVPLTKQKSAANLSCREKRNLSDKKPTSGLQISASETANRNVSQKVKKCASVIKSEKATNDKKASDSKSNKQLSLKNNIKYNDSKKGTLILRTNVSYVNKKLSFKKETKPKFNAKSSAGVQDMISLCKTKEKSHTDIEFDTQENNNMPILKNNIIPDDNKLDKFLTPKVKLEKENKMPFKQDWFSAQKDIKFETNEFYRNMILSERELSPSICRLMPSLRLSSVQTQRPSLYQKFELSSDPYQEAMKALQNACLSVRRGDRKVSVTVKENKAPLSPYKDRGSFYTPCSDPKAEVMKSLQELKIKQLQKSIERVTFNLTVEECMPKNISVESKQFKNTEFRLAQINEKSEENTPKSPQSIKVVTKQDENDMPSSELDRNIKDCTDIQEPSTADKTAATQKDSCMNLKCEDSCSEIESTFASLLRDVTTENLSPVREISQNNSKKTDSLTSSPNFICNNEKLTCDTDLKFQKVVDSETLGKKNVYSVNNVRSAKIYTPRPISLFSKSRVIDSSSPEFLVKGKSTILPESIPICTPLILKSIAKSTICSPETDLSPVRLKLDFTEVEKCTPKKEISRHQMLVENIATIQKKLDDLADKECFSLLLNETIPTVCGRYLTNPVALILNEGDDMHFIPIQS